MASAYCWHWVAVHLPDCLLSRPGEVIKVACAARRFIHHVRADGWHCANAVYLQCQLPQPCY